jgi:hypothetical protein
MADSYVKLFNSILKSTVWEEDPETRIVWITLLVEANRDGEVFASVPGLARVANVSREKVEAALDKFHEPDADSSSPAHDGRRIETINGGWRILNFERYNERKSYEYLRQKNNERQQRYRARHKKLAGTQETP